MNLWYYILDILGLFCSFMLVVFGRLKVKEIESGVSLPEYMNMEAQAWWDIISGCFGIVFFVSFLMI